MLKIIIFCIRTWPHPTQKYVFRSFRLSDPENISTCSLDRQMVAPSTSHIATLNTQSLFYPFQMDGQLADFSQDYACIIVMLLAGNKQSFMTIHTGNGFTKGAINSANWALTATQKCYVPSHITRISWVLFLLSVIVLGFIAVCFFLCSNGQFR